MMFNFKAIALTTLLVSGSVLAEVEIPVFNCQISETEHVSMGLMGDKLSYYYDNTDYPDHSAVYPGEGTYGDFTIYHHMDAADPDMPKDIFMIKIKAYGQYSSVITIKLDPNKKSWATGEVRSFDNHTIISKWQCRFPPLDAYNLQKAFREKALSKRYTYTDVNPLGSY